MCGRYEVRCLTCLFLKNVQRVVALDGNGLKEFCRDWETFCIIGFALQMLSEAKLVCMYFGMKAKFQVVELRTAASFLGWNLMCYIFFCFILYPTFK